MIFCKWKTTYRENIMLSEWKTAPVIKKADAPVLTYKEIPYPATCVFNAGVARYEGKYIMVFRNDVGTWGKCGMCFFAARGTSFCF